MAGRELEAEGANSAGPAVMPPMVVKRRFGLAGVLDF